MAPLVWMVTGSTSGIGASLVKEITARGDKVIATGRKVEEKLGHLKSDTLALLEFDVTAERAEIDAKIKEAWDIFGHIDVVMNNAGVAGIKSAEEADDAFVANIFNVNLFGPMHVTQAILPFFRAQGHGVAAFISSSSIWAPLPFMTHYAASKAALSVWAEGLHRELSPIGINCVCIEPGGSQTNLGQPRDPVEGAPGGQGSAIAAYEPLFNELAGLLIVNVAKFMANDVERFAARIVDVVKLEGMAAGKPWTVRVSLGSDGMGFAKLKSEQHLRSLDMWKEVSSSTGQDGADPSAYKALFEFTIADGTQKKE